MFILHALVTTIERREYSQTLNANTFKWMTNRNSLSDKLHALFDITFHYSKMFRKRILILVHIAMSIQIIHKSRERYMDRCPLQSVMLLFPWALDLILVWCTWSTDGRARDSSESQRDSDECHAVAWATCVGNALPGDDGACIVHSRLPIWHPAVANGKPLVSLTALFDWSTWYVGDKDSNSKAADGCYCWIVLRIPLCCCYTSVSRVMLILLDLRVKLRVISLII